MCPLEWDLLELLAPPPTKSPAGDRPPKSRKEIVAGIRYVLRTGCAAGNFWLGMPRLEMCEIKANAWSDA